MNDNDYKKLFDNLEGQNHHFACGILMAARYGTAQEFTDIYNALVTHNENQSKKTSNDACEIRDKIMKAIRIRENIYPEYPIELR